MTFKSISIDGYLKKHMKNNPQDSERDLRDSINKALIDFEKGVKCSCGNDIWVVGSAIVGNSCFRCITGENYPTDYYEIDSAIKNSKNHDPRKNIDHLSGDKIFGFFDDEGFEINSDLVAKSSLCITCIKNDNPKEEFFCNMTRYDQKDENMFRCFAYVKTIH